jgi:hypothetical protein
MRRVHRGPALPRRLRRRLEARAESWIQAEKLLDAAPESGVHRQSSSRSPTAGWLAAVACLLLAVIGWWPRLVAVAQDAAHGVSPLQSEVEKRRQHLLAAGGPSLGRWSWVHESGLPAGVAGEVAWHGELQQGYLTLSGLAPSTGTGHQYQVWIFDGARDDRYPVDGGVFDVPEGAGTVTVPVRPALRISRPSAFAITLERSGGVVVSDRSHLMALARATPP